MGLNPIKILSFFISLFALRQILIILPQIYNFVSDFTFYSERGLLTDHGLIRSLIQNSILVLGFIFQHTFMAKSYVKTFLKRIYLDHCERGIYLIMTSFAFELLINNWIPIHSPIIWNSENKVIHTIFSTVHNGLWLYIFMASILFDLMEMFGIKQVYHFINDWGEPLMYKTSELQNIYKHMRHPSFYGFCLLFWLNPIMTLDRFLFAFSMTLYMIYGWRVDEHDCFYIKSQWNRKEQILQQ